MGDDITIGVTEIVNNIEVTAQPNDQIVDISVIDNADEVTLNITPTVIEINVNKGSSYARWGTIYGNITDQTDLQNALLLKADLVDGKVPAYQLPSFVDDIIEVANYAALPATGETGKIYVTLDNNKIYRWSGSIYIEIAANNAIWGSITGTLSNQTDLQNALNLKANDNAVVKLTGDQSIAGVKTFTSGSLFDSEIYLKQDAYLNPIIGYTAIGSDADNIFIDIDGSKYAVLNLSNITSQRTFTFPNASGTLALTSQLHDAVTIGTANGLSLSGQVLSLALASPTTRGALTSEDYNYFFDKVQGNGNQNYIPKYTLSGSNKVIGNSQIYDNGTNVGIGTTSPSAKLHVAGGYSGFEYNSAGTYPAYNTYFGAIGTNFSNANSELDIWNTVGGGFVFRKQTGASAQTALMTITSGGNVGIGTTSPDSQLVVNGASNSRINMRAGDTRYGTLYADSGAFAVGSTISIPLILATNDTEKMRITSGGLVGIGTTSPSANLSISSGADTGIRIKGGASALSYIDFDEADSGTPNGSIAYNHIDNAMTFASGGSNSERMRITSGGNVYINATSGLYSAYGYAFGVKAASGAQSYLSIATPSQTLDSEGLVIGVNADDASIILRDNKPLDFWTNNTNRMRITSGGLVGIGTTSPLFSAFSQLTVNGTQGGLTIQASSTGISRLFFAKDDTSATEGLIRYEHSNNSMNFWTAASERMRITSGGNVGIGTSSPIDYQVYGYGANIENRGGRGGGFVSTDSGATNRMVFSVDGNASVGQIKTVTNTPLTFGVNDSERMRITSNGELCIGRTSAYGAGWLVNVEGNIYATADIRADLGVSSPQITVSQNNGMYGLGTNTIGFKTNDAERMRITSDGNVGIGTESPVSFVDIAKSSNSGSGSTFPRLSVRNTLATQGDGSSTFNFSDFNISSGNGAVNMFITTTYAGGTWAPSGIINVSTNHDLQIKTNNTERMRITSGGNVLIKTSSEFAGNYTLQVATGSAGGVLIRDVSGNGVLQTFQGATGTEVGSITQNSVATSYNTISDYRLKQDLKPINGLDLVSQIKVYDYEWKIDESRAYGVLAHELQEVIPQAVNGEKDGENMQGVDYSKLVPILVQAIQELKQEIEILKNK